MPTHPSTLTINVHSSEQQLSQAVKFLDDCDGAVFLQGIATLRPTPGEIVCEVADPVPGAHRCAEEFKVLVENAQRAFAKTKLADLLTHRPQRWLVVDGHENIQLWPEP